MDLIQVAKNIKLIQGRIESGDDVPTKSIDFFKDDAKDGIFEWFKPANNYPEFVISEIRKGVTLESILFEDLIYKTGSGFNTNDALFSAYLNDEKVNVSNESFKTVFKDSNDHFSKLGNVFLDLIFDEKFNLISTETIQPQKNRLLRDKKNVWIFNDWKEFDKKKAIKMPLYPRMKKFSRDGMVFYKSIYHIKNKALGFDHYGINDKMIAALLLNEKEYRRNNWQNSQIKRGFKRDFYLISEFPLTEKEKRIKDEAFKKSSGDDYAGGVETIEGENARLVPADSNYEFDFAKDDTSDQLFLKMGFPRSLIGIRQRTGTFSAEQIESDYDQYLPKVEGQQAFLLSEFSNIYNKHTKFNTKDWNVINNPPSVILQNYMEFMTDDQKNKVIERVFTRYGIK